MKRGASRPVDKCPKCKPKKYGWEVVALAKRDDCQELAVRWDKLNWRDYKMYYFEKECCRASGEYSFSDGREDEDECDNEDEGEEEEEEVDGDEEGDDDAAKVGYLRRECGPWSPYNECGRHWCTRARPGMKFIRDCLELEDLWGHVNEPWVYTQLAAVNTAAKKWGNSQRPPFVLSS